MLPAVLAIPNMRLSFTSLVLWELSWTGICAALVLNGLAWFRIELDDQGITRRGLFTSLYITWPEATVRRVGLVYVVSSAKGLIRINPFAYQKPKDVDEFLSPYLAPSLTSRG